MNVQPPVIPSRTSSSRKVPGRLKSSSAFLDDIGECEVLVPSRPRRYKSTDELDACLWDASDTAEALEEERQAASAVLASLADDMEYLELDLMDENSLTRSSSARSVERIHSNNSNNNRPNNLMQVDSFCSVGSNISIAQERHPGRFITPMNSGAGMEELPFTCGGVLPVERITVEPHKLLTADVSFRLPLVRRWSSKQGHALQHQISTESSHEKSSNKMASTRSPQDIHKYQKTTIQMDLDSFSALPFPGSSTTETTSTDTSEGSFVPPVPFGRFSRKSSIRRNMQSS